MPPVFGDIRHRRMKKQYADDGKDSEPVEVGLTLCGFHDSLIFCKGTTGVRFRETILTNGRFLVTTGGFELFVTLCDAFNGDPGKALTRRYYGTQIGR